MRNYKGIIPMCKKDQDAWATVSGINETNARIQKASDAGLAEKLATWRKEARIQIQRMQLKPICSSLCKRAKK